MSLNRTLKVLDAVSAGPMTLNAIYKKFFKKEDGSLINRRVFNRFVQGLEREGYIEIFIHKEMDLRKNKPVRIALLKERGSTLVCFHIYGREKDHLRTKKPKNEHMRHEIFLSNIIRIIRQEQAMKRNFYIEYILDDLAMKSAVRKKGSRGKNIYYPDLGVKLCLRDGTPISFYIELDCGSKGRKYWINKVKSWEAPTIVVFLNPERMELFIRYVINTYTPTLFFITYDDFKQAGLSHWLDEINCAGFGRLIIYEKEEDQEHPAGNTQEDKKDAADTQKVANGDEAVDAQGMRLPEKSEREEDKGAIKEEAVQGTDNKAMDGRMENWYDRVKRFVEWVTKMQLV